MITKLLFLVSLSFILYIILSVLPLHLNKHTRLFITMISFFSAGLILFTDNFLQSWQTIVISLLITLLFSALVAMRANPMEQDTYTFSNLSTKGLIVHVNGTEKDEEEAVIVENTDEEMEVAEQEQEDESKISKVEEDSTFEQDIVNLEEESNISQMEEALGDVTTSEENHKEDELSNFANNAFELDELSVDTEESNQGKIDSADKNESNNEFDSADQNEPNNDFDSSDRIIIEKDSSEEELNDVQDDLDVDEYNQQGTEFFNKENETEYHFIDELKTIDDLFALDDKKNKSNNDKINIENQQGESWISKEDSNDNESFSFLQLFSEEDLQVTDKEKAEDENKQNEIENEIEEDQIEEIESTEEILREDHLLKEQEEKLNELEEVEELTEVNNELSDQKEDKNVTSETTKTQIQDDLALSDLNDSFGWKEDENEQAINDETPIQDNPNEVEMIDLTLSSEDDLEEELVGADEEENETNISESIEELKGLNELEALKPFDSDIEADIEEGLNEQINILNDIKFENENEISIEEDELQENEKEGNLSLEDLNVELEEQNWNTNIEMPNFDKNIQHSAGEKNFNGELIDDGLVFKGIHSLHKKSHASMEELIAELNEHKDTLDTNGQLPNKHKEISKVNSEVFKAPLEDDEEDVEEELRKFNFDRLSRTYDGRMPRIKKYKKKWWQVWK